MLWLVCKSLHLPPNDERLKTLEPLQISWILDNLKEDSQEDLDRFKGSKSDDKIRTDVESEIDEDTFQEQIEQMRSGKDFHPIVE